MPAFTDVVWARYEARRATIEGRTDAAPAQEARFRQLLADFETARGTIERAHWATSVALGLAITSKPKPRILRLLGVAPQVTLHRGGEQVRVPPEMEAAFHDGDVLAVHAQEVLTGGAQRAAVSQIFAAQSYLVSLIDSAYATDSRWVDTLAEAQVAEHSRAQQGAGYTQRLPPDIVA